jgi:hypothetical protein
VTAANEVIRRSAPSSGFGLDGWYLRAAGHLCLCQSELARGDLRVARKILNDDATPAYRWALERFQGPLRTKLERLHYEGLSGCVPNPDAVLK